MTLLSNFCFGVIVVCWCTGTSSVHAWITTTRVHGPPARPFTSTRLPMGFLDGIAKAFGNAEYGPPPEKVQASARHILVQTKEEALTLQQQLVQNTEDDDHLFSTLATQYSTCPSGKQAGGALGSFSPGTMVPEFDKAIFNPDTKIGQLIGPVSTKFGYHLIVVDKRTGGGDWY